MDTRNSAMVVGLYLVGIVIIVVVSLGYYVSERSQTMSSAESALSTISSSPSRTTAPPRPEGSAQYYHSTIVKANQSLRELQLSLATTRDRLEQQTQSLNKKNAECQALKEELDRTFSLILNLLADESTPNSNTRESTQQAKSEIESELSKLTESLKQSEVLGGEQAEQLGQLRTDLQRADQQLRAVQEQSELEMSALLTEKKNFDTVVTELVARCGTAAVPLLVERLSDERFEIRRWAVKALGAIGPEAQDAVTAMKRLLSDPDASVREEAQRALTAIGEPAID